LIENQHTVWIGGMVLFWTRTPCSLARTRAGTAAITPLRVNRTEPT